MFAKCCVQCWVVRSTGLRTGTKNLAQIKLTLLSGPIVIQLEFSTSSRAIHSACKWRHLNASWECWGMLGNSECQHTETQKSPVGPSFPSLIHSYHTFYKMDSKTGPTDVQVTENVGGMSQISASSKQTAVFFAQFSGSDTSMWNWMLWVKGGCC